MDTSMTNLIGMSLCAVAIVMLILAMMKNKSKKGRR